MLNCINIIVRDTLTLCQIKKLSYINENEQQYIKLSSLWDIISLVELAAILLFLPQKKKHKYSSTLSICTLLILFSVIYFKNTHENERVWSGEKERDWNRTSARHSTLV